MSSAKVAQLTIDRFERGDIDAEDFDHEAHLYVAWLYLERYPVVDAIAKFSAALRSLTERLGVPDKYHATVTWFYLLLIAERRDPGVDWAGFCARNPDLFDRSKNVLARYYRADTLASGRARARFVLPDLGAA